ncbi:DUF2070 family protein [Thermoplasma acidophilum]|uniref:DUF2070 family protein n=1 Tax=Thermoplasma acidophilum TaxID=2303 RepID=UPI001F518685|nr:DUF2070 family protein [Thermoplasma acidophilum]MCY0851776.1 DUF2070 family protein [Thermoplasma acidophilum]
MYTEKQRSIDDLSTFVRKSISPKYFIAPLIAIGLIDYYFIRDITTTLLIVPGTFLISILLDLFFTKISKIVFPVKRNVYLNFVSLVIWNVFFWILILTHAFRSYDSSLLLAISSTTLFRFLIFYVFYPADGIKDLIPSMNYVYSMLIIFILIFRSQYLLIVPFIISSLVYALAAYFLIRRATAKFVKKYKSSPSKILEFFLNSGKRLESNISVKHFFDRIYSHERKIPVKLVEVRRMDGSIKVSMIFPYIHPGPFGVLGSSNLPERLSTRLPELGDLMVFHTTTSNDNNCRGDQDIDNIAEAIRSAHQKLVFTERMARPRKVAAGKFVIYVERFGNFGLGAIVPEKTAFDDVALEEGLKIIAHMKKIGADDFAVIDAQNNFRKKAPELKNASPTIKAFEREFLRDEPKYETRIGYARVYEDVPGLASMGIQAAVLQTGDRYDAVVLTDSNNITTDLIERVRSRLSDTVSSVEIYTTDNHYVNASVLDVFPLGSRGDADRIADLIALAVKRAKADVEPVKVGMATDYATVKMGEKNNFQTLISTVFSAVRTAKFTAIYTIPTTIATTFLIFRFI